MIFLFSTMALVKQWEDKYTDLDANYTKEVGDLKANIVAKEQIINDIQQTLNEHLSASEVLNEQNAICRKEYQISQQELGKGLGSC